MIRLFDRKTPAFKFKKSYRGGHFWSMFTYSVKADTGSKMFLCFDNRTHVRCRRSCERKLIIGIGYVSEKRISVIFLELRDRISHEQVRYCDH
jgi:hypothetical protein